MANSKAKANSFERQLCRELSLWWSDGASEDVFWRSQNSGGRATTRSKKGKTLEGQYGDICATDESGKDFLKVFTVEVKRGYGKDSLHDLIDKPRNGADQTYEKWITQAFRDCKAAGVLYSLIVHKRDRRETCVLAPEEALKELSALGSYWQVQGKLTYRLKDQAYVLMTLADFVRCVDPDGVRELAAEVK